MIATTRIALNFLEGLKTIQLKTIHITRAMKKNRKMCTKIKKT